MVTEHMVDFEALSKYGVKHINTPLKKNQKFVYELKKNLKKALLLKLEVSFEKLVDTALRLNEEKKDNSDEAGGVKRSFSQKKHPFNKFMSFNSNKTPKKQGHDSKELSRITGECFNCGSKEHFIKDCPKPIICVRRRAILSLLVREQLMGRMKVG